MTSVRAMRVEDASRVASLSAQLGYPVTEAEIRERLLRVGARVGNACFVATDSADTVLGWVHIHEIDRLETALYAEIGGLVVDEAVRARGVGKALMLLAEQWAIAHGYPLVRLSSGLHRADAHRFYETIGYRNIRTSYRFEKILAP